MITGKYADLIREVSAGRSEITTKMVHDVETKLYFIRKRTLVDSPEGLVKKDKNDPNGYSEQFLKSQQERWHNAYSSPSRGFMGQLGLGPYGSLLG